MTFNFGMGPLTSSMNEGSHVAPMTHVWLKSIKACGRNGQMLPFFFRQQQWKKQSLCKASDTKSRHNPSTSIKEKVENLTQAPGIAFAITGAYYCVLHTVFFVHDNIIIMYRLFSQHNYAKITTPIAILEH